MRPRFPVLAALLAATLALPAHAKDVDEARFDVSLRGFKAGQLVFKGEQSGSSYAVAGKLQSTGIVAAIRKVSYDAQSRGTVNGARYTPSSYTEKTDTGKRKSSSVLRFKGGVPQVMEVTPARAPRDYDVNPSTQAGSVDVLTALYAILRDQTDATACTQDLRMFDGRRATRISLTSPKINGDTMTCTGEYRRIAGFSPKDMAERARFPYTATLKRVGDKWRVMEVRTATTYGDGVLRRR